MKDMKDFKEKKKEREAVANRIHFKMRLQGGMAI